MQKSKKGKNDKVRVEMMWQSSFELNCSRLYMSFQGHKEHSVIEEMEQISHQKNWRIELQKMIKCAKKWGSKICSYMQGIWDKNWSENLGGWTISFLYLIIDILEYFAAKYGDQNHAKIWGTRAGKFQQAMLYIGKCAEIWILKT